MTGIMLCHFLTYMPDNCLGSVKPMLFHNFLSVEVTKLVRREPLYFHPEFVLDPFSDQFNSLL